MVNLSLIKLIQVLLIKSLMLLHRFLSFGFGGSGSNGSGGGSGNFLFDIIRVSITRSDSYK